MPFIRKKIESEKIELDNVETTILDVEKTKELVLQEQERVLSLSYKDIEDLRSKYVSNAAFQKILSNADERWTMIKKNIDNVEVFYEIIWSRTHLELMFLTRYYSSEIVNPLSFEMLIKNKTKFEYWWINNVKYNLLNKLKIFYIKAAEIYANLVSVDIFETDVEMKAKEAIDNIEDIYLDDVKAYFEYEWNKSKKYYEEIFKSKQDEKRKSIIFD